MKTLFNEKGSAHSSATCNVIQTQSSRPDFLIFYIFPLIMKILHGNAVQRARFRTLQRHPHHHEITGQPSRFSDILYFPFE